MTVEKKRNTATIIVIAISIMVLLLLGQTLKNNVAEIENILGNYRNQVNQKAEVLLQIHRDFGYGGFIHHFKNLVLRQDPEYITLSEASLENTYESIERYRMLDISDDEILAMNKFRDTVKEYDNNFKKAVTNISMGSSPAEIDNVVKVNDAKAFAALKTLADIIDERGKGFERYMVNHVEEIHVLILSWFIFVFAVFIFTGMYFMFVSIRMDKMLGEIKAIFTASPDAIVVSDITGSIREVNQRACELFGYSYSEFMLKEIEDLVPADKREIHVEHRQKFQQTIAVRTLGSSTSGAGLSGLRKDGSVFPAEIAISTFQSGDKRLCISIARDITSRIDLERKASTDHLTSLSNRECIDEILHREVERARRYRNKLSVIMMDIDHFKAINDTYGHQQGDQSLVQFGKYLISRTRGTDIVGRWGGEEFCVICPGTGVGGAVDLAENIRSHLQDEIPDKTGVCFTISSGVAEYDLEIDDEHKLLKKADDALYEAKKSGRNRTVA